MLKIDTKARTACTFADLETDSAGWNWHGGALSPDGKIYGIPCNAGRVLAIDPKSMTAAPIGPELPGKNKWYGGIRGNDGAIYGVSPESHRTWQSSDTFSSRHTLVSQVPYASTSVLRIGPGGAVTEHGELGSGGYKW